MAENKHLSPYGRALLKELGGDPTKEIPLTPHQVRRWAKDRPESVLTLMPDPELSALAAAVPDEWFKLTEDEVRSRCPEGRPSRLDRRVRIQFWDEYEHAAKEMRPMDLQHVVEGTGVLTWESYRTAMATESGLALLVWFMSPPAGYQLRMREATELGVDRLMDIMELPLKDEKGRVQVGVAALILAAYKLVSERAHGSIAQKLVSLQGNMGVPSESGGTQLSVDELDKKLKELDALIKGELVQLAPEPRAEDSKQLPREVPCELLSDASE